MLNSLINVMWLHCLNLQVYWLMKHGNSLKCIVFVMYQVASFQQMFAQRYLYDHQRKIMFCYFALVPVTCGFPCMHCWSRQEMLQQFFKIRVCEKGWLEYQQNLCSIRLQQQNVACTIVITWRPEFQNVQGLPWQEYYVLILGMQATLIRPNCFWFYCNFAVWHCHIKISSQRFVVEAYAWPQDFLRKHHSVRKKQNITTWVLGGRFIGGWGCKLLEWVSEIAPSREKT